MSAGSGTIWSRRALLLLMPVVGLAGCALMDENSDPYIPTMKKDPMFSWRPSMKASRSVFYSESQSIIESKGESEILITFVPEDITAVPALLKEVFAAMTAGGYSGNLHAAETPAGADKYSIRCVPGELPDHTGVEVTLTAPIWG